MKYFWNILGIVLSLAAIYLLYFMNMNSFVFEYAPYEGPIGNRHIAVGYEKYIPCLSFLLPLFFIASLIIEIKYPNATIKENE